VTDPTADKAACAGHDDFNIIARAGLFTVNFRSPYNSLHQISGFKTEHDAQAWVAEARHLAATYL
jgi:hypothetical protein